MRAGGQARPVSERHNIFQIRARSQHEARLFSTKAGYFQLLSLSFIHDVEHSDDGGDDMAPSVPQEALAPLFILRVLSPSIVLLATLSLVAARPPTPTPPSLSPITSVVVATRTHRRALIYALLSLAGLTFLLDGLAFVVTAVVRKEWPEFTGLDINAVVGLVAFTGLAALGAWKEVHGVDVWSLRRFKVSIFGALALDVVQVVLLALAIPREYPLLSSASLLLLPNFATRWRRPCVATSPWLVRTRPVPSNSDPFRGVPSCAFACRYVTPRSF